MSFAESVCKFMCVPLNTQIKVSPQHIEQSSPFLLTFVRKQAVHTREKKTTNQRRIAQYKTNKMPMSREKPGILYGQRERERESTKAGVAIVWRTLLLRTMTTTTTNSDKKIRKPRYDCVLLLVEERTTRRSLSLAHYAKRYSVPYKNQAPWYLCFAQWHTRARSISRSYIITRITYIYITL